MGPWPKDASGWTQVSGDFCIPHEVPSSALHAAEKRHVPRGPSLTGRWRTHLQPLGCCCCSSIKACPTLCDPLDRSTPGFLVHHHLPKFAQTHVRGVGDATQPSHPLPPSSPFAVNLSQHQSLFQQVGSSHQVARLLELQLQHQSFEQIVTVDFLLD